MAVLKILFLITAMQVVHSKPVLFKEMHMKRNFEFSLKPIKLLPIAFIKEKWSTLGHVGSKHVIGKRSPVEVSAIVMPLQNVPKESSQFRVTLEKSFDAIPPVSPILPPPIENELPPIGLKPIIPIPKPGPVIEDHPAPESLGSPSSHGFSSFNIPPVSTRLPPSYEVTEDHVLPSEIHEVLITPTSPVPVPLLPVSPGPIQGPVPGVTLPSPQPPTPAAAVKPPEGIFHSIVGKEKIPVSTLPPPAGIRESKAQSALLTDIARVDQINSYLKAVDGLPLIKPPLEENLIPGNSIEAEGEKNSGLTGSLVKGSRIALYFGNILLQVMSEVINSARSAISQYSKPAPI